MDPRLDEGWTVAQVIQAYPQTVAVFIALKTDCVGCYLDKFCTLTDVAAAYDLSLQQLLDNLYEAIQISVK